MIGEHSAEWHGKRPADPRDPRMSDDPFCVRWKEICETQRWLEMAMWCNGGESTPCPWCRLCGKWVDEAHIASDKCARRRAQYGIELCESIKTAKYIFVPGGAPPPDRTPPPRKDWQPPPDRSVRLEFICACKNAGCIYCCRRPPLPPDGSVRFEFICACKNVSCVYCCRRCRDGEINGGMPQDGSRRNLDLPEWLTTGVAQTGRLTHRYRCLAVHWQFGVLIFGPVFCRFSATFDLTTSLERRGSSCSAGCIKNQPRSGILRICTI
jgi:hypothetical protein